MLWAFALQLLMLLTRTRGILEDEVFLEKVGHQILRASHLTDTEIHLPPTSIVIFGDQVQGAKWSQTEPFDTLSETFPPYLFCLEFDHNKAKQLV